MNLNWDSLLEPIFLFILSLIAGTLWVIIPANQNRHTPPAPVTPQADVRTVSLQRKPAEASPLAVEASGLMKASAELGVSIKALQKQSQLSNQELAQLQEENRQSIIQIEGEKKTLKKLTEEVKALETQPSSAQSSSSNNLAQPSKDTRAETEALRKVLAEKEGEVHRLQAQLEATKARPESEIPRVPTATPANKLPVLLELIHNRAVPFSKEFYRSRAKLFGPTIIERRSEGETIAEIRDPDSAFHAMLNKLHPDKQYISCLLNSDSFPIFREVRRLVQAKHIDLGWEPMDTSSGKITVYPVHLTKKAETNPKADVPRVPPIMR